MCDTDPEWLPAALADLPASSKLVYRCLCDEGPCTWGELAARTHLPSSSIQHALDPLRDHDLLVETPNPADPAHRLYAARPTDGQSRDA